MGGKRGEGTGWEGGMGTATALTTDSGARWLVPLTLCICHFGLFSSLTFISVHLQLSLFHIKQSETWCIQFLLLSVK